MKEFERVYHSDNPYQYPVILKVKDMERLFHYRLVATRVLGPMESGSGKANWYYARGYFFFANDKVAQEFELAARPVASAVDPNWFNSAINRIQSTFA